MQKSIAIFTTFQDFNPGYSLTGIVVDQAHMLLRQGHIVTIFVNEQYNPKFEDEMGLTNLKINFENRLFIANKTKFMHLRDYEMDDMTYNHQEDCKEAATLYAKEIVDRNVDIVYTHDFVFTGWNLPYFYAIKKASDKLKSDEKEVKWYHWVHSVPSAGRQWWNLNFLGENHYIVFPNKTEIMRVAESYKTVADRVKIIPHIKDIRTWYDFGPETMNFLDIFPNIMQSEVIQIYPCSTDRMGAKQLDTVIKIFGHFKRLANAQVFLVIANQWATGRGRKEDIASYHSCANEAGLVNGKDYVFTSEVADKYAVGISKKMLRELQLLSNIFIFPTKEESFGLVGPEAALSGALPVINRSLIMQFEVMSNHPPAFDFGSFHNNVPFANDYNYLESIAIACLNRLASNEAGLTKSFCRRRYNMDSIYHKYYLPNMI